jgi:hypothetical protein
VTYAEDYFDLYDWRNAVASPVGPQTPSTRLVLLTLSLHMNPQGVAWPSQKTLARRSGLSLRTVKAALDEAERYPWIVRKWQGRNGQGWRLTRYHGVFPSKVDVASKPWESDPDWRRGAAVAPPFDATNTLASRNVVQTASDVVQPATQRGAAVAPNVVQQLPTNSSSELLKNSPSTEGPALARPTSGFLDEKKPEPEVRRGRRKPTVEAGLKFIDALLSTGTDPIEAWDHAKRANYPVTAEALREHLAQRAA